MGKVVIVDYKLGNLFSVKQACDHIGLESELSSDKKKVLEADALILPGVGAFKEAMDHMEALDLIEPFKDFAQTEKPILGVCLGLQLLFSESEEFGSGKGLNIIEGTVKKIPKLDDSRKIRVPQIGWNTVKEFNGRFENTPLEGVKETDYFYFVHSFYVEPASSENIVGQTTYENLTYSSVISNGKNVFATQFHPEKSAEKGIGIYQRWAKNFDLI